MFKLLAIGNSFSQDATHYLHQLAAADGLTLHVANLYIGGCSLQRHWENIQANAPDYLYEENGESTGRYVSIEEALCMEEWDYIVTQQASHDSGLEESYDPYLENIAGYLRAQCPSAELLLQQTWAYEIDSMHPQFGNYDCSQAQMYQRSAKAYRAAAAHIGARLIPCGDVIQALRKKEPFVYEEGGMSICRDGFHMNVIYGRYLLAATWYRFLFGKAVSAIAYTPQTKLAPNAVCNARVLGVVQASVDALVPVQ